MLKELVEKGRISFHEGFDRWQDAIAAACEPLLKDGTIEQIYVDEIIKKVTELGPYIVIAPNIAIPHAQEGYGVHDTAVCFMRTERPVSFSDDGEYDARLFFVLASVNNDEHLKNLVEMSDALSDEDYVEKLLACKTAEDLLKLEGV
ncbi:MAG: PTS sugar transporter subunit IIA [Selenomonadales bacterium]|mgnify:CR=1 FL=1|nr:PTS sugar transporter subunit IIA [Selenomonadales bacterium]MDY3740338.1 PTS sugar transporter subunit IIA [Selenomonadaceae bacterium]MEE1362480.1 PTS sugar transporter subunit IIA [Selenomonadaceae bacterium]